MLVKGEEFNSILQLELVLQIACWMTLPESCVNHLFGTVIVK